MKRKFSFDIPKLKIGSLRPEGNSKQLQDGLHGHLLMSPAESRPPTPKSVRPPLPGDIDAELRAACTYIITHPKPSHERWDRLATRPALDYASIKADAELAPMLPVRTRSARHKTEPSHDSSKYSYKPNTATEDLFKSENGKPLPQTSARSRADQLMAGGSAAASATTRHIRSGSHPPLPTTSQQPAAYPVRTELSEKPRISGRSDSVGTSGSTPHTDSTDYPWSASTGLTSAAVTPARSKRTSSQAITSGSESGSAPRIEAVNAEWMRSELEKHKKLIEESGRVRDRGSDAAAHTAATAAPHIITQVPARKPVPSRPGSRQARDVSRTGTRHEIRDESNQESRDIDRAITPSIRLGGEQHAPEAENRGRLLARSSSRLGKAARSASRVAAQAASRAESITNDIIGHYFRPGSEQSAQEPVERPPSRARDFTSNMRDYFRPGSATGNRSRKPSGEFIRGHRRSQSFESQQSGVAGSEHSLKWKGRFFNRSRSNIAMPDANAALPSEGAPQSPAQPSKPPIDLNRELPPLPSLDQWKDDEPNSVPAEAPVARVKTSGTEKSRRRTPVVEGLRRALSRKDLRRAASPTLVSKEEVIATRLGNPTPPRSQKQSVDVKRLTPNYFGDHPLPSPPALSASSGLSSPLANEFDLSSLSLSQSVEPVPSSRINQARPDYLRPNTQAQQLTPERTSRRTPHIADHSRHAVPAANANVRSWSRAETNSSTPFGHSRESSDRASAARKYSMDDYSRQHDSRYQNKLEVKSTHSEKKRRWWHSGKDKKQAWMDQVVKSGARNGTMVDDEVAGAPVVRY